MANKCRRRKARERRRSKTFYGFDPADPKGTTVSDTLTPSMVHFLRKMGRWPRGIEQYKRSQVNPR
jgi:hypothetical protein